MADENLPVITESEFNRIYGGTQQPSMEEDLPVMTESQYRRQFGSFWENALQGVKDAPGMLVDVAKAAGNFISSPMESIQADPLKSIDTAGRLGTAGAASMAGAVAGAPLAPFTLGLSVPVGAAIGGAAGLLGYDKLNQAAGNQEATTAQEDINNLGYNIGSGTALGVGGKVVGSAVKGVGRVGNKMANVADKMSDSYAQEALGARPNMIAKSIERNVKFLDDEGNIVKPEQATDFTSRLEQQVKDVRNSPLWDKIKNNPKDSFIAVAEEADTLRSTKNALTAQVDDALAQQAAAGTKFKLKPIWKYAEDYIENGKGTAGMKDQLAKQLEAIKTDWAKKGGSFEDLIKFKSEVDTGKVFNVGPNEAASVKLREAILRGIKESAEQNYDAVMRQRAPELVGKFQETNKQLSNAIQMKELLGKKAARAGSGTGVGRTLRNIASIPKVAAGVLSFPIGLGGEAAGVILAKALTDAMPVTTANALSNAASATRAASAIPTAAGSGIKALGGAAPLVQALSSQPPKEGQTGTSRIENSVGKSYSQPISTAANSQSGTAPIDLENLPPLVKAIIQVESAGNPKAKSPKGAEGLMQLMPEIQKAFGVTDPTDPQQNIRAGVALLEEELNRFGDLALALAAYNAGSPRVRRAIKKAGTTDFDQVAKHLPAETREYVNKIAEALA